MIGRKQNGTLYGDGWKEMDKVRRGWLVQKQIR